MNIIIQCLLIVFEFRLITFKCEKMMVEEDRYVIHGEESPVPIPEGLLGKFIFDTLSVKDVQHDAMVDAFTGKTISYDQILEDSCNLGEALRQYGCNSNTVISVCSENSLNFYTPVIASLYLGASVAPINQLYTEDELRYTLTLHQPKILFCSVNTIEKFLYLKLEFDFLEKLILIDDSANSFNVENIFEFIDKQLNGKFVDPKMFTPLANADPCDNVSFILSSSGTTGLPKGVMLTDRNMLVRIAHSRTKDISTGASKGDTVIGLMPFFHGYGLNVTLGAIVNKEKVIVFKRFDEDVFLKAIQDYKIPSIGITPALVVFLAKSPKVQNYDLSSLQEVLSGAAPLSKELENQLKRRLNISSIRQGYGLTEANLAVTIVKRSDSSKSGSSGQVVPFMSLKIRDPESGKTLGPNQVGEICIKGPMVMKGYYKNPQSTKESFTEDGWLKSGDLGYFDEDKYLFVVDRLKELIKYKGYQVAPAELEAILVNHPKVLDVGVVGAPDELAGELPLAFVVKKPGFDVSEKELIDTVAKKVSPQKRLRGGVIFIEAIPKNASGKILRRELRKLIPGLRINRESKL